MKLDDYYYQYVTTRTFKNREEILDVSKDIEHSFTGRIDVMGLHIFFEEAATLIRNAIKQYEEGFFDCAFYSIRSALEIARIVAYFSNQDEPTDADIYKKWVQGGKFPYDSQIRGLLNETSDVYAEVRRELSDFFKEQDLRLRKVQKYIHKQGYGTFYNQSPFRPDLKELREKKMEKLFSDFITQSTIEIALLRLCIDPFPILLQDENVMYKIHFEAVTEPFREKTVKLIGKDIISKYCNTEFYRSYVSSFSTNEELQEPAYNIINHQYYDQNSRDIIIKQLHLLSERDRLAIKIFDISKEITKVYIDGGFIWYYTDTSSVRNKLGFSSESLRKLIDADIKVNTKYDEALLSYFSFKDFECWVEHNSTLNEQQMALIKKYLEQSGEKLRVSFF